jgi:hypothetical protein
MPHTKVIQVELYMESFHRSKEIHVEIPSQPTLEEFKACIAKAFSIVEHFDVIVSEGTLLVTEDNLQLTLDYGCTYFIRINQFVCVLL